MKLRFLGTGAGNFRGSGRHPSSVLVDRVLLDCGAGATGRLHDLGRFSELDAVLLTHLHTDHISGLFDLLLHTVLTGRTRPLTIVAPPGLTPIVRAAIAAGVTVKDPGEQFPLEYVEAIDPAVTVGPWRIRGVALEHTVPNVGYRLETDGLSLFYTGDTRSPNAAAGLRADYLVHEATFPEEDRAVAERFGHSTGRQAGATARAMGARRLFLTHIGDAPDLRPRLERESRREFAETTVASDGDAFDL